MACLDRAGPVGSYHARLSGRQRGAAPGISEHGNNYDFRINCNHLEQRESIFGIS